MADLHVEQKRTLRWRLIVALSLAVAATAAAWYFSVRSQGQKASVTKHSSAARPSPSPTAAVSSTARKDDSLLAAPMPGLPSATSTQVTTTSGIRATREEKNAAMPSEDAAETGESAGIAAAAATGSSTPGGTATVPPPLLPSPAAAAPATDALTDLAIIVGAPDPAALDGRAVSLSGMKLQRQVGGLLAIGTDSQHWVLVAPAIGRGPKIPSGATLAVNGRLQRLPPLAQAAKQWQISKASQQHLTGKQIYVQASVIDVKR